MAWIYLFMAGLMEVAWAVGLKYTDGFTRLVPSVATIVMMIIGFILLSFALRSIPISTAYAVWTGIGVVGTALIGMMVLGEPRSVVKILSVLMIVIGITGLKIVAK